MLKSLALAANTLTSAVNVANTAWDENVALTNEANKRYATTESRLGAAKNSFNNLKSPLEMYILLLSVKLQMLEMRCSKA